MAKGETELFEFLQAYAAMSDITRLRLGYALKNDTAVAWEVLAKHAHEPELQRFFALVRQHFDVHGLK